MKPQTKKWIATAGIGVTAYYALSLSITQLPQFALLAQPIYNGITVLTVAAGAAVYGIFHLWNDY